MPHRRPDMFRRRRARAECPVTSSPVAGAAGAGGPRAGGTAAREYVLVLGAAAAGGVLVLLSVRQGWAQVVTAAPAPLPSGSVPVRGQDLVPVAGALAVVSLAALAAVIATRGLARRLVGMLLAVSGALTVLVVSTRVSTADVLAAVHGTAVSQAGSATAGGGTGAAARHPRRQHVRGERRRARRDGGFSLAPAGGAGRAGGTGGRRPGRLAWPAVAGHVRQVRPHRRGEAAASGGHRHPMGGSEQGRRSHRATRPDRQAVRLVGTSLCCLGWRASPGGER